jgi:G:T-mismatch repair DNA endonuclease (very short patch repair protein)
MFQAFLASKLDEDCHLYIQTIIILWECTLTEAIILKAKTNSVLHSGCCLSH